MAQPNLSPRLQAVRDADPELYDLVAGVYGLAQAPEGAIPLKYRILMMVLGDALLAHPDGCTNLARQARAAGATDAEIAETLRVAYQMGGVPALFSALGAYECK